MLVEPSPRQLEDALNRRQGGASLADATGITPSAEELEALLGLGDEVGALRGGEPDPSLRESVRAQFLLDAEGYRAAWIHSRPLPVKRGRHPLPSHGFRWTMVVGTALVLALVAGVTLALAAQLAEPDGQLYGLKQDTEQVLLLVNRTPTSKASVHLQLASQRFRDAESMAATGKGDLAVAAMASYYDHLRQAGRLLISARRDAAWKSVRDQFDSAEAKQPDILLTSLQANKQTAAAAKIQALAASFAQDRKSLDVKLNPPAPAGSGGTPQPLPSGATGQPGASGQPGAPTP